MFTIPPSVNKLTAQNVVSQISVRQSEYEVDIWYLVGQTMCIGLSSMQFQLAVCQIGPVQAALRY